MRPLPHVAEQGQACLAGTDRLPGSVRSGVQVGGVRCCATGSRRWVSCRWVSGERNHSEKKRQDGDSEPSERTHPSAYELRLHRGVLLDLQEPEGQCLVSNKSSTGGCRIEAGWPERPRCVNGPVEQSTRQVSSPEISAIKAGSLNDAISSRASTTMALARFAPVKSLPYKSPPSNWTPARSAA